MVRHGQFHKKDWKALSTGYSLNDLLLQTDGELTKKGKKQAEITAQRLKNMKISTIYCSSLQRTKETAEYFSNILSTNEIFYTELLWECLPTMPPNPSEEVSKLSSKDIEYSRKKADKAFHKYFLENKKEQVNEILICHGNLIRYFVCKILNLPIKTWTKMEILNCGITLFSISNDETRLVSHNDSGHFSESMKSYT